MANLITIDEYKTYKSINSEQYDPTISLLIGSVTNFIQEYTGRQFIDYSMTNKVEYFDATSYPEYYPEEFPIISVAELAVSTDGGVNYTTLVENADYFVDTRNDRIISNTVYTGFVSSAISFKSGRLTYKGGYTDTPYSLKVAAMDLVHYFRNSEYTSSKSIASASTDNKNNIVTNNNLPPHIKRVLDLYRVL